jgi:hypothetical protein
MIERHARTCHELVPDVAREEEVECRAVAESEIRVEPLETRGVHDALRPLALGAGTARIGRPRRIDARSGAVTEADLLKLDLVRERVAAAREVEGELHVGPRGVYAVVCGESCPVWPTDRQAAVYAALGSFVKRAQLRTRG